MGRQSPYVLDLFTRNLEVDTPIAMVAADSRQILRVRVGHHEASQDALKLLDVGSKINPKQRLNLVTVGVVKALPQYAAYAYFLSKTYIVFVHPGTRRHRKP